MLQTKILVIQDSATLNMMFNAMLDGAGYSVEIAETGEEGIKKAKDGQFQLILLDYTLPDINGLAVCQNLKEEDVTKNVPILFISAKKKDEILETVKNAGAVGLVTLPVKPKDLIKKIKEIFKNNNNE